MLPCLISCWAILWLLSPDGDLRGTLLSPGMMKWCLIVLQDVPWMQSRLFRLIINFADSNTRACLPGQELRKSQHEWSVAGCRKNIRKCFVYTPFQKGLTTLGSIMSLPEKSGPFLSQDSSEHHAKKGEAPVYAIYRWPDLWPHEVLVPFLAIL